MTNIYTANANPDIYICYDAWTIIAEFLGDLATVRCCNRLSKLTTNLVSNLSCLSLLKQVMKLHRNLRYVTSIELGYLNGMLEFEPVKKPARDRTMEYAIKYGQLHIVQYLLNRKNSQYRDYGAYLCDACRFAQLNIIEYFLPLYKPSDVFAGNISSALNYVIERYGTQGLDMFKTVYDKLAPFLEHRYECYNFTCYGEGFFEAAEYIYLTYLKGVTSINDILDYQFRYENPTVIRLVDKYGTIDEQLTQESAIGIILDADVNLDDMKYIYERFNVDLTDEDIYDTTLEYLDMDDIKWLVSKGASIVNGTTTSLEWLTEHIDKATKIDDIQWVMRLFADHSDEFNLPVLIERCHLYQRNDIIPYLYE